MVTIEARVEARWDAFWRVVPYAFLVLAAVLVLADPAEPWSGRLLVLGGAVFAAGWMWFMVSAHPHWTERLGPMLLHVAVLLGLSSLLITVNSRFAVFVFAVFVQVLAYLPGAWAYAGVAVTAVLLTGPPAWEDTVTARLPDLIINVVLVSAIGLFIRSTAIQSERRRQALAELAEAHARLSEYAEENASLQARLVAQAREAGVHDERARLAGEIHDTLAQGLAGIVTQLEAAAYKADDVGEVRRRLSTAHVLARDSLAEARRSVHALRPEPLENARLPDALSEVAGRWSSVHRIPVTFGVTGETITLHPEVEVTLLRAAQEALANIARHAHATKVGLTLSYMEDVVALDVRDDGVGMSQDASETGGFGLGAMRARVTRLGGTLAIESTPGHGTAISASVPAILLEGR
ncbi:sensor histidine kinase [Plantactinospora mayteni]|uniref:Oxygen sensor histidine kinase NreB n=1 Tax=Plantactinospora mayteni TaxID=566021 RepID=A0ABQ4F361_9ACTN|nr:sensor histidine kinase [Plantactinospora mayteni]GIH01349.1 histidine kinase [Plantactinospora mayteni]